MMVLSRRYNGNSLGGRVDYDFGDGMGTYQIRGTVGEMVYFNEILPPERIKEERRFYKCGYKLYCKNQRDYKYHVNEYGERTA